MLPRVAADYRALFWVFVLMPGVAVVQYLHPSLAGWLLPISMYLAYSAAVLAHNHNHTPVFRSGFMNEVHSTMISFFYGYPAFGWIPTHNENHHRYNNREGDATITWRGSHANTLGKALLYFFVSTRHQAPLIANYLKKARKRRGGKFGWLVFQYVSVFGGHACAAALAIHLHGWSRGLFVYASALGIPAFGALWGIMFTNYLQHVDCDAWSTWNHSRNFVSPWMNFFVFENGFHTVHHERPGLHWSLCRAEHERIAANVDPRLNENSIFGYCFKTYVLAYFSRRFASVQVGRPSYETPTSTRADDVAKAVSEEEFVPAE